MNNFKKSLGLTDVVLRDAHQSLFATRLRLDDMLPIAGKLDQVGFWSLESWGGATFDACIRFLGEDPWHRIRELKKAMPMTPQQMLFRGQNILGYRHYADDIVDRFVERAAVNGIDVFRIFDAMNDTRNLKTAIAAVKKQCRHAQGTISYTVSPVHTLDKWLSMAREIEDMGADSLCIKDMAGLLAPYPAFELISSLKKTISIPVHLHCHATTGLSTATYIKAVEAGIDNLDTAISSMSLTYGHTPTETMVAMLEGTERETGLNIGLLEEIASYFREVRKKYAQFEGALKGIDSRILVAQVPGGMLTNLENQLREQKATNRLDEVLLEIPKVRKDLGYIPLVTPTSQIVGTQAVLNVLSGERYKNIAKETEGVLKGEYGATPAPVNAELQKRVLGDADPVTCRPADLLSPEFEKLQKELIAIAAEKQFLIADAIDDTLTYALFPQPALKFFQNRDNPDAFEPVPGLQREEIPKPAEIGRTTSGKRDEQPASYVVEVDGRQYKVRITPAGEISSLTELGIKFSGSAGQLANNPKPSEQYEVKAPLSGVVQQVIVSEGEQVADGDIILVLEAMKMETEIRSNKAGTIVSVHISEGDNITAGDVLVTLE